MSRTKHLHIMYVAILATMLMSVYFYVPINRWSGWIYWLVGSIAACVGFVAMLLHRRQWSHIMLSICAGLLCVEVIAVVFIYGLYDGGYDGRYGGLFIGLQEAVCRIVLAVGLATFYYLGYMRKFDTEIDVKRCVLYVIVAAAVLVIGRMRNGLTRVSDGEYDSVYGVSFVSSFNVYMLLAELAAASFIVVCDRSFSKYYAVGVVGFACVMAIVNLATSSAFYAFEYDYYSKRYEESDGFMFAFAFISKIIPVVGITAVYCCYTLIGKLSGNGVAAGKTRSTEKSEIDLKLERLESLKADGTLDDEEYKNEVIKLLGGKK